MRRFVLGLVLVFVAVLLALTIHALVQGGPDILTVLSALVLALFGFGIVGALLHPSDE
jgi:cytochrome c biogenesis protein CcdA